MDAVAEIKARLNIVDVLAGRLEMKRAGKNFKARCPFHNEKTPSFIISPERGFAWCYGCNTGGDIFKMVELLEGVDFKDALKLLAEKAGVELPKYAGDGVQKEKKDQLLAINARTAELFAAELQKNATALEYLTKRGMNAETIEAWQIGYAPESYDWLHRQLSAEKFSARELAESGVAGVKELGGEELYDRFRGRVMFPIRDARGRVVAFTGRILENGEPKYLNSPESPIFTKGAILFGLDRAKESIRKKNSAIIVEGQMDVIACHQAGFANVVASSGTALTETHLRELKKITDTLYFSFDGDTAGIESTRRAIALAQKLDFNLHIIVLPDDVKDPDEALQKDPQIFSAALEHALPILDFYFQRVYRDIDFSIAAMKKKVARELLVVARNFASAVEREEFIKALSLRLKISERVLLEEFQNLPRAMSGDESEGEVNSERSATGLTHEELLLGLLLAFPALAHELAPELVGVEFTNPEDAEILRHFGATSFDVAQTLTLLTLENREHAEKLTLFAADRYTEFSEPAVKKEILALLHEIAKKSWEQKKREVLAQIHAAEEKGDDEAAGKLAAEYQKIMDEVRGMKSEV